MPTGLDESLYRQGFIPFERAAVTDHRFCGWCSCPTLAPDGAAAVLMLIGRESGL